MPEKAQLTFGGGLNAAVASDKLAQDEVQAAENIDFSLEVGAARVRRGAPKFAGVGTSAIRALYNHYNDPALTAYSRYAVSGTVLYRSTNGTSYSSILTGLSASDYTGFSSYRGYTYYASGSKRVKDTGTSTFDWAQQSPTTAPTIVVNTATATATVATVWTVSEGTIQGSGTSTATATVDSSTFRVQFDATPTSTNLNTNGTSTIGDYGVDYLRIRFSDPRILKKISRDYSIGDTTYKNYWHTEIDLLDVDFDLALPSVDVLIDTQLDIIPTGTDEAAVDFPSHATMHSRARRYPRPAASNISQSKITFNSWAVARSKFQRIGPDTTAGWTNIAAARVIVECVSAGEVVEITDWGIVGSNDFPLNDPEVGYAYWESYVALDTDANILWESAASPPSLRTKMQHAKALVTLPNVPTGTSHGYTHKFVYRQGGFVPVPYRIGTFTGTTAGTFTDTQNDINVLALGIPMVTNLMTALPNSIQTVSQPFRDRIFVGYDNKIAWSLPGNPDAFPKTSTAVVANSGDNVRKLINWPHGLIIINLNSVYELTGSVFEGPEADYIIQRVSSRHGGYAPNACIPTEYGVALVSQDGLFMYQPGQGIDAPVQWFHEKARPIFQGPGAADPAALEGSRVPALNQGFITNACATYRDGKVYLGLPCGTATTPNTLFVIDFVQQKFWYYTYPWTFSSILWDFVDNKLMIGADDGNLYRAETGLVDNNGALTVNVAWKIKTRSWTTPADTVMENLMLEQRGDGTYSAIYDNTSTVSIGTATDAVRTWFVPKLSGTFARSVEFYGTGTQTSGGATTLYNIGFDTLVHPVRVTFYRTDHDINNWDGEKIWDVHFADLELIGTCTVLGTVFVDNTAIMTATITGPPGDRQITPTSFPPDTYGDVAYTIYNAQGSGKFKHWKTDYECRNEPARVTSWVTDRVSLEENIIDAFDTDINPNGTVLGTVFIDNTAVTTGTFIGTKRQSFTTTVPVENYGRTLYVLYTGTSFKHYQTWYHQRREPDRWVSYVSDRNVTEEQWYHTALSDINCYGNTVLGTCFVALGDTVTAISTFTYTGNGRQQFARPLPEETYGDCIFIQYNVSSGVFKHYKTWFLSSAEPERLTFYESPYTDPPSENYIKTWLTEVNPLGTCVGTLLVDGVVVSTATFTGTLRNIFEIGAPNVTTGKTLKSKYTGTSFKHYRTSYEFQPKPFQKKTWLMAYKKTGGVTQLDMARFYDIDIEPTGTATVTCTWKFDGATFQTDTHTLTARTYKDRQSFAPGGRHYLAQCEMTSAQDFKVWRTNMDIERIGVKGFSRTTAIGTPVQTNENDVQGQPVQNQREDSNMESGLPH